MFKLKIVTPNGIFKELEAQYAEFTTVDGSMGVLTDRLPIVSRLKVSSLLVKDKEENEHIFAINGGVLEMDGKELIILTTDAENPEDIDVDTAMKAIETAKNQLKQTNDTIEKTKLNAEIEKNMVRINVAKTK